MSLIGGNRNSSGPAGPGAPGRLPADVFDALRRFDSCTVANAIERCGVRLRNEGFTRPGLKCLTGGWPRLLGYAATARVRSSDPPMNGSSFLDRTDWWTAIAALPIPRIAAIQSLDPETLGSVVGEVHAAILKAFHCEGVVTDGAIRDLPGVSRMQFPMFAREAAVSHSYTHLVDYGTPIEIFGLKIKPGDLVLVDVHGALSIPAGIAADLPAVASEIRAQEQRIIDLCQSPDFSPERLLAAIKSTP